VKERLSKQNPRIVFFESRYVLKHVSFAGTPGVQRRIKMNVVLYGATGNSGQRILKELTHRGHHVTAVARDTSKIPSSVKAVKDDLSSIEAIASIIAGTDVVVSACAPSQDNTDALLGVTDRQIAAVKKSWQGALDRRRRCRAA
jgi:NAD(P)-dependent dehydrogenase (short-subunit alcohol dehydrogenase family)